MRLLLDTHILLWTLFQPHRLSQSTHQHLSDPSNTVYFSAASIWEISIKQSIGRLNFVATPTEILEASIAANLIERPITAAVTLRTTDLPLHHKDPFDRLLIAQAIELPSALCTVDLAMDLYRDLVELV